MADQRDMTGPGSGSGSTAMDLSSLKNDLPEILTEPAVVSQVSREASEATAAAESLEDVRNRDPSNARSRRRAKRSKAEARSRDASSATTSTNGRVPADSSQPANAPSRARRTSLTSQHSSEHYASSNSKETSANRDSCLSDPRFMRAISLLFRFKDIFEPDSFDQLERRLALEGDLTAVGGMERLLVLGAEAGFLKKAKRGDHAGFVAANDSLIRYPRKPSSTAQAADYSAVTREIMINYERQRPTKKNEQDRERIVKVIATHLGKHMPEAGFVAELFGSGGTGLYSPASDIDVCCYHGIYPPERLVRIWDLKRCLTRCRDFKSITAVEAKIPIVKMVHAQSGLKVDVSIENTVAIENTKLIKLYCDLDSRVRPLLFALKTWCKSRAISHPEEGSLSSYSWTLLMLHYLQRAGPAVLPNVQYSAKNLPALIHATQGNLVHCFYDPDIIWQSENTEDAGQLFAGFFDYYARFDFAKRIVDVRGPVETQLEIYPDSPYWPGGRCGLDSSKTTATAIAPTWAGLERADKLADKWPERDWAADRKRIAIQDPFLDGRNTAVGCHDHMADWILDEIHRAHRLLRDGASFADILEFIKR
ncbi:hypothetical protein PYCC9005_002521 [Savitreella phatthalungensis]